MKYFKAQDFNLEEIKSRLKEKNLTIGVVIPVYNEEKTIAQIVSTFRSTDLISSVYVIDDGSDDNTIIRAKTAGAVVFDRKEKGNLKYRNYNGKGFAIWEALSLVKEDILIIYDGDVKNPSLNHIVGLAAPLINDSILVLTKASFDRNLYLQDQMLKKEGGRITELLIKPLLGFLFPDLVLFQQPTGGLYGVRKNDLAEIKILGEIGADISILINLYKKNTIDGLCETYIGEIIHNNKDLKKLSKITFKLIQSIFFLHKGLDNFRRYSYLSLDGKVDVNSSLIVLEPKASNNLTINKNNDVAKAIIHNSKGEFLLQLRDNNPNIEFPLHWNLFGGVIEKDETSEETIIRELREELEIKIKDINLFKVYDCNSVKQYIYSLNMDLDINKINLKEGLSLKWFNTSEIDGLKIAFNYYQILRRFQNDNRNNFGSRSK